VNKCQTIWVWVGRVARPGMSQLVNKINQRVRQPFMFHYAFFCLGSRLEGVHCHNLMHFVHKLMHLLTRTQN